ncbi:MAG: T9SS type A sorting domain-containing protein [Bacteroidetes bacterium]|nr:T9SS type A sorting domain-containing protein [Bacteroidota bacterium]
MRNTLLVLFTLINLSAIAQDYHWDFAMSAGTCRLQPGPLYENLSFPLQLETDHAGNAYVLGIFPTALYDRQFVLSSEVSLFARSGSMNNQLYLYKINTSNKIEWALCIEAENASFEKGVSTPELTVNPYSGKFYLLMQPYSALYVNGNPIYPQLATGTRKMMLCFESDGRFNRTISSEGILNKPVFASAERGVYKGTRIVPFTNGFDSITFYTFDAIQDTVIFNRYSYYDNLLYFDQIKQVFITEYLGEYDLNLNRIKGPVYQHTLNDFSYLKIQHKQDKSGNHYFHYKNNVVPGHPATQSLFKLDASFKEIWRIQSATGFQMDTSGNLWLFKPGDFNPSKDNTRLNPSDAMLVQLNPDNGQANGIRIVPTNLIEQSYVTEEALALFKISSKNEFWISGNLINEAEFGKYTITGNCSSKTVPYQHYLAKAKWGWSQDRKNLSLAKLNTLQDIPLYPNPASDFINLPDNITQEVTSIEVFSFQGQLITDIEQEMGRIDLRTLNPGIYFMRIQAKKGTYSARFIKR